MRLLSMLLVAKLALVMVAFPAAAQKTAPDRCLALAQNAPPPGYPPSRLAQLGSEASSSATRFALAGGNPQMGIVHKARLELASLKPYQVRVTYHGHSTFTIESPKGVTVATDYNDYVRPAEAPTIATMNVAHDTHHSYAPDPKIKHVLRGWNPDGDEAQIHDLVELDMRVRNVPTNIRSSFAGPTGGRYGNSIFIFEVGTLCIAHLGHLHHTLTVQQLAQIGQMDVVFVPIDGSWTLDTPGTFEVLKSLRAPIVVPMHWFSGFSLEAFVDAAKASYEIVRNPSPTIVISKDQMPAKPRILVMPPGG